MMGGGGDALKHASYKTIRYSPFKSKYRSYIETAVAEIIDKRYILYIKNQHF